MSTGLLGLLLTGTLPADVPSGAPAPATQAPAGIDALQEVMVQAPEPKYVAPTRRDRIGRIWAPVMIDGKGPFRLVLDTGANHSAITARTAQLMGVTPSEETYTRVTGFTGSAEVPTVHVAGMEVGDVLMGPADLPVLSDVFGGAQGVLGMEGLRNKRIYADFVHDNLVIARSHGERARPSFVTVPLRPYHGLLVADCMVGSVHAKAIIDTGAQGTVGNLLLRDALMRHPPHNATQTDIIGVSLDVQSGDYLPMPDIRFGENMTVKGVHVTFGDMYLFQHWGLTDEPALTLGMDLLGTFDVLVIDYARSEMQIQIRTIEGSTTH